jgi:hypothetical protein
MKFRHFTNRGHRVRSFLFCEPRGLPFVGCHDFLPDRRRWATSRRWVRLFALLVAGCNQNMSIAPACRTDLECDMDQRCVNDACLVTCDAPGYECPSGESCYAATRSPVSFDGYWSGFVCHSDGT